MLGVFTGEFNILNHKLRFWTRRINSAKYKNIGLNLPSLILTESHLVPKLTSNIRLSDYIHLVFEGIPSRKSGKKAIKNGSVWVDGQLATTGIILREGMVIQLLNVKPSPPNKVLPLPLVIYEDDEIIIVNKQPGIATSGNLGDHLLARVKSYLYSQPGIKTVHRLDKATSGIVIMAKTTQAAINLSEQFRRGQIKKRYSAIVIGTPPIEGIVNLAIDEKQSCTTFKLISSHNSNAYGTISLLNLYPKTGRRHQLRKHLKSILHPIVGDHLYGEAGKITKGKGMCLVASKLSFIHPKKGIKVTVEIDLPKKFRKVIPTL